MTAMPPSPEHHKSFFDSKMKRKNLPWVALFVLLLLVVGIEIDLSTQFGRPEELVIPTQLTLTDIDFHEYSVNRIRAIVNESSIMVWRDNNFAPFKALFDADWVNETHHVDVWKDTSRPFVLFDRGNLCKAARAFYEAGAVKNHILLMRLDENWGALSAHVPNRTINWGPLSCSKDEILTYLNHNRTLAVITTQHQAFDHPKVHSIPIGVKEPRERVLEHIRTPYNKTQLLMINFNNFQHRPQIARAVIDKFGGKLNNTYDLSYWSVLYQEMRQSKFVLCPSGLGFDTYRAWESLYMGAIPIIERYNRTDGWHRTLDGLPVLWVDNMEHDVTPDLLQSSYKRFSANAASFNYEKLTVPWWVDFVNSFRNS